MNKEINENLMRINNHLADLDKIIQKSIEHIHKLENIRYNLYSSFKLLEMNIKKLNKE